MREYEIITMTNVCVVIDLVSEAIQLALICMESQIWVVAGPNRYGYYVTVAEFVFGIPKVGFELVIAAQVAQFGGTTAVKTAM